MENTYSILIVDDVRENIDVLNGILKDDYSIKAATNGEAALKIANKFKPDLVLLDVMMPDMDGYEVCTKLKSNPITKDIPVIFVTAKDDESDEAKGFEIGAVDYITKPVNAILVKSRVKTHIELGNQRKILEFEVIERTKELNKTRKDIINILGRASEFRDNETGLHVIRVSEYCYIVAKQLGFSEKDARLLKDAAPMHDVGKIGIPDRVLSKPGKLDEEEWKNMMTHTTVGGEILGEHDNTLLALAKEVAMQHHEKYNGKGYPYGISGEAISMQSRIVAICDVFDALTSERPYKKAWDVDKAIELLKSESGEHFDKKVVNAFLESLDEILAVKNRFIDEVE